jgi:methionyl-tRNA synthetase
MSHISFDDFKKVEIKVGQILTVEKVEGSEKLLKLSVNFNEEAGPRKIVSGVQKYFPDEQVLVNKKCMFVTNLEPRTLMGLTSDGMLFAVGGDESPFSLLEVHPDTLPGTLAK